MDVYRRRTEPERNYLIYLSYVMFFPLLVAGPIERAWHLIPQFKRDRHISADKVRSGLLLCASGFFKKLVIADNVAVLANYGFGNPSASGATHLIAVYAFAFQIYCDFSGYSDIAAGTARILGFEVFQNFNLPYLTTNPERVLARVAHQPVEFFPRLRLHPARRQSRVAVADAAEPDDHDAAVRPLARRRLDFRPVGRISRPDVHRVRLPVAQRAAGEWVSARKGALAYTLKCLVFFQFVCLGWLLFRSDSVTQAIDMLRSITFHFSVDPSAINLAIKLAMLAVPLMLTQIYQKRFGIAPWEAWQLPSQVIAIGAAVVLIALLGAPIRTQFIYFQF